MRLAARLAAGKLTLLSRSSAASRTTDGEYLSLVGFVLLHGGNWKRSTRVFKSSVRGARRILGGNDADVSHRYQAIPENSVKDANNPSSGCPNGFEHLGRLEARRVVWPASPLWHSCSAKGPWS